MATGSWTDAADTVLQTTIAGAYVISNTIDTSEVADGTSYTGAGGDIIECLTVPADTLVTHLVVEVTTAQTASTDTVTFDVGITGGDVDGFLDGGNAEATGVTVGAGAHINAECGKYFASEDTIDMLIINSGSTDATDDMVFKIWAVCVPLNA